MPPVFAAAAAIWAALDSVVIAGSLTLATVVANIAISVALTVVSSLLVGTPKQPSIHGTRENFRNPVAPRRKYIGRVKAGGVMALLKLSQIEDRGNLVNGLFAVIAQAQGKFERQEEIYLGDGKVTLDGDIVVQPRNYNWNGTSWVILGVKNGSETQGAMGLLTSGMPGVWTDEFQGLGVPYVGVRFKSPVVENFTKVFPSGLPAISTVARTSPVYDPRDPTQLHSSSGHWKFSSNAVLNILHVVMDEDCLALPWDLIAGGIDVWCMEANYCDLWRPLANGGSEPMYRLAGGWELTDAPKNWLPKLLVPLDARIVLRADGSIVPSIGRWVEPELTISDNEVVSYSGFARGKPKANVKNRIDGTFISPDYDYIQQQADSFLNEDSIDIDGEQSLTIDGDFCPSHAQLRVRMKIELGRQDPERWNGTIITKAYGLKFLTPNGDGSPKRFVNFVITELGVDTSFEVLSFSMSPSSGNCTFQVSEMLASDFDFDPATDEGTPPAFPRDSASNDVENPHNLQISVSGSQITATIDTPLTGLDDDFAIVMDYRQTADAVSDDEATWTALSVSGETGHTGSLGSGRYDVRARLKKTIHVDGNGLLDPPTEVYLYSDTRAIRGIKIGTGVPAPVGGGPSAFSVTDCGGHTVQVQITAAVSTAVIETKVWAAAGGSSVFADASVIGIYDTISSASVSDFIDVGATGTWNFWATSTDITTRSDSAPTGPVAVTVSGGSFTDPAPLPSAPTNVVATPNSSTIAISWDANPSGDSVTNYEVRIGEGDYGYATPGLVSEPTTNSYVLTGLLPGTDVNIRIVAVNANGSSDESEIIATTTLELSKYRQVTASSSTIQLEDADTWVDINNTTGSALTILMPDNPIIGQPIKITDEFHSISDSAQWTMKDSAGITTIDVLTSPGSSHSSGWTGSIWRVGGGIS